MNGRTMNGTTTAIAAVLALISAACVPLDSGLGGGGGTDLSGSVDGTPFSYSSGGADSVGESYVITLADTPEFSCSSFDAPPLNYVSISISGVDDAPTTYDAAGNVFFNSFVEGVSASEPATSGTVTIDDIDPTFGEILGSVDASNADSEISGSFAVETCR